MVVVRDRALVLRRFRFGESSLVLHVLTRERGRVHLMARGAYRAKSRYAWVLDLFDTLEIEWQEKAGRELQELREAGIGRRRAGIARDLGRFRAGATALELAELCAREGDAAGPFFEALEGALEGVAEARAPADELLRYELRLLDLLGLAPAFARCASCGKQAPAVREDPGAAPRAAFSALAGGRLCAPCARQARAAGRRVGTLPTDLLGALDARARAAPWSGSERGPQSTAPGAPELARMRDVVARFLVVHLESSPKSYRPFLDVPHRNAPRSQARAGKPAPPIE